MSVQMFLHGRLRVAADPRLAGQNDTVLELHDISIRSLTPRTSPLRKAAAAAGDPELVNLWAGVGWRDATDEPAAEILRRWPPDQ